MQQMMAVVTISQTQKPKKRGSAHPSEPDVEQACGWCEWGLTTHKYNKENTITHHTKDNPLQLTIEGGAGCELPN